MTYTEAWEKACARLARAMFGVYNHNSGGLAHDGQAVPTWSEIVDRGSSVLDHWAYLADCMITAGDLKMRADKAQLQAKMLELRHEHSEVFNRVIM